MRKGSNNRGILQSGGLWFHYHVGRVFKVGVCGQSLILTTGWTIILFLASSVDHSLLLPGRDVGFFEHPTIWTFFILQTALPLSMFTAFSRLQKTSLRDGEIGVHEDGKSDLVVPFIERFLQLRDNESRAVAALLYSIGIGAWAWNSYQNQFPNIVVPYDFWDSTSFSWGYAATRFYKAYLFVALLPYLALIHIATLVVTLRIVRQSRISANLRLQPFHPDGAGGLGFVADLISKPIVLTLLIGAASTAAVFLIHRALGLTPALGLLILLGWTVIAYVWPIIYLSRDIAAMKREMISRLRLRQREHYSRALEEGDLEFNALSQEKVAFEYFEKMCEKVKSISRYPHLKRVMAFTGLALSPTLVAVAVKGLLNLFPAMARMLGSP